jgi:hypothetical protein
MRHWKPPRQGPRIPPLRCRRRIIEQALKPKYRLPPHLINVNLDTEDAIRGPRLLNQRRIAAADDYLLVTPVRSSYPYRSGDARGRGDKPSPHPAPQLQNDPLSASRPHTHYPTAPLDSTACPPFLEEAAISFQDTAADIRSPVRPIRRGRIPLSRCHGLQFLMRTAGRVVPRSR